MADELLNLDNLRTILEEYAVEARNLYQDNLIKSGRIASGDLLNSVECRVDQGQRSFSVVLTLADYWKYVEEDTAPHWPPRDALLRWISVKPVIPRPDAKGRIPSPQSLAFLIGRRIAGKSPSGAPGGTTGTHDLRKAVDAMNAKYHDRISDALGHDMTNYIAKVMAG